MASVAGAAAAAALWISFWKAAGSSRSLLGELLVPAGVSQQGPGLLGEIRGQRGVARHQGKRIEQDDLVAVARQVLRDHATGRERDLAFA